MVHGSGRWFVRSADSVLGQTGSAFKDGCECWSCHAKAGFPKKDGGAGEKRCLEAVAVGRPSDQIGGPPEAK